MSLFTTKKTITGAFSPSELPTKCSSVLASMVGSPSEHPLVLKYYLTPNGKFLSVNKSFYVNKLIEEKAPPEIDIRNLLYEKDRPAFDKYLADYINSGKKESVGIMRLRTLENNTLIIKYSNNLILNDDHNPLFIEGIAVDITEQKMAEWKLRQNTERMNYFLKASPEPIYEADGRGFLTNVNPAGLDLLGYTAEEIIGKNIIDFVHPDDQKNILNIYQLQLDNEIPTFEGSFRVIKKDNSVAYSRHCITAFFEKRNGKTMLTDFFGISQDITQYKIHEEKLNSDEMTTLLNKSGFENRLKMVFRQNCLEKTYGCLLFIDINGFKSINDTYGHDIGDIAIIKVANAIKKNIRNNIDLAGRYGGDEFLIYLPTCNSREDTINFINRLIEDANEIKIGNSRIRLSIGAVFCKQDKNNINNFFNSTNCIEEKIKEADKLMYKAKNKKNSKSVVKKLANTFRKYNRQTKDKSPDYQLFTYLDSSYCLEVMEKSI